FFQAEDGIRDFHVTGVQTCALPIWDTLARTQDYELAYYLAKNSDSYKQAVKSEKKNADAERIVQNANKAGSLSSVGQTSPINQAKRYKEMSDAEFMQHVQKNLGYY